MLFMVDTHKELKMMYSKNQSMAESAGMKVETEGLIIATQGQSLPTSNYQENIIKNRSTRYVDCANKKLN